MREIAQLHPELQPSPHPFEKSKKFVLSDHRDILTKQQKKLVLLLAQQRSYEQITQIANIAYQTLKNEISHLIKTIPQHFPDDPHPTTSLEVLLLLHKHGILKLVEPKKK